MTKITMPLSELLEKHDEGDFLRAVVEAVPQLIMEANVEGVVGAGRHERTADRTAHRNGYRDRPLDTRLGTLNLRVPRLRQGSYSPGFLEPRPTSEKALVALAIVLGPMADEARSRKPGSAASRRAGWTGWSKRWGCRGSRRAPCQSSAATSTTALASSFTACSPEAGRMSGLDATHLRVRQGGRIVSVAAIIAVAANTDGRRESEPSRRHWFEPDGERPGHRPLGG